MYILSTFGIVRSLSCKNLWSLRCHENQENELRLRQRFPG